jgi:leucyl/phenylalanyl-tRNA---protein transferase
LPLQIPLLNSDLNFPPVNQASREGILAIGGDLSPERLMLAYKSGIFPWFNDAEPIIWWSTDPRMVLFFDELKVSKSMKKVIEKKIFKITFNQNFRAVIENCKKIERDGQSDTWISNEMIAAYCKLNEIGKAKSIEVWQNDELVGGLYGVDLGNVFCGESMFSKVSNASKIAFVYLVEYLKTNHYKLLDCQVYNDHLASLGCRAISRNEFMQILNSK